MQMTPFKFFWICSSITLISGCSGLQTKPYSLASTKADFMAEYCQSGRQTKAYKTTVIYFTPDLEKGISLDKANQKKKSLAERKDALLKELFYLLGDANTSEQIANQGDKPSWYSLVSDDEADTLKIIAAEDSNTKYRLFTFIIKIIPQNKIIVYQSNLDSRRMSYNRGFSTDLNNLMNEYTILMPKEVIEEITGEEFNSRFPYSAIILNENGEVDLSKAIENRDRLWKAYIQKFTLIKEANDDNSKKSAIELSLDLNTFCKYGRRISDVQSQ